MSARTSDDTPAEAGAASRPNTGVTREDGDEPLTQPTSVSQSKPDTTSGVPSNDEPPGDGLLMPGSVAGDYRIRERIGWGGCSTVYAADHVKSGQEVAVKIMHRGLAESPRQVQRFVQEAQAVRLIHHPSIVEVFDIGRLDDGRPYIVMELLEGINLATLLRNQGRLSPAEAYEILAPVGAALAVAHEAGIVHRDIKASNIIVQLDEAGARQIKLLDFGIAKLVGSFSSGSMQTTVGHVLGTPHSMAPEQIKGRTVDGRTDIYALGALLYRLLTGRHPFEGHDALTLTRMHIHTPPPLPSQSAPVSPALDTVVRTAMEKDPGRRFQDVEAFVEALGDAVGAQRSETIARALGIYVEGRIEGDQEPDDADIDDLMTVLDTAEQIFERNAFAVPLATSNAVLGALLVAEDALDETLRQAMDVATEIDHALARRDDASDRVLVNLCLHLAEAVVTPHAERPEIVGGPIIDIGSWAPKQPIAGVCATPETLGMPAERSEQRARSYVRIVTPHDLRVD
ncbi:serine/threonine-protein kinase [Haliangium sp.]|uniref:serine/threonine-protein kinase n=1 Tax=Haliangium sp. TaxID=2663208 RepID=UPI003D0D43DC